MKFLPQATLNAAEAEPYATRCNTLSVNCLRCSISHRNLSFIPNYCFPEAERDIGREGKGAIKRFMHYDGKGPHTLMAFNGPELAARWVDERRRTWRPPLKWWHSTTRPHVCTLTHTPAPSSPTHSSAPLYGDDKGHILDTK